MGFQRVAILTIIKLPQSHVTVQTNPQTSLREAQVLAGAAVRWANKLGVNVAEKDMVNQICGVGTKGVHPSNAERDMHVLIKRREEAFHVPISTVKARMYEHKTGTVEFNDVSVIFPDDLCCAIGALGEDAFRRCFAAQTLLLIGSTTWTTVSGFGSTPLQQLRTKLPGRTHADSPF